MSSKHHISVKTGFNRILKGWKCVPQTHFMFLIVESKTAITLAPPTVGRQSADLSADKMPDFSSFFIGRQKINYNYLVIIFFFHRPTVLGFWQSADDRPTIGR